MNIEDKYKRFDELLNKSIKSQIDDKSPRLSKEEEEEYITLAQELDEFERPTREAIYKDFP